MTELWELIGRFLVADGIPTGVKACLRFGFQVGPQVVVDCQMGMSTIRGELSKITGRPISLFAAGEVIRFAKLEDVRKVDLFKNGLKLPAGSASYYEALGLCMVDPTFRDETRFTPPFFGPYETILANGEKEGILTFTVDNQSQADAISDAFRNAGWGGKNCRVAFNIYEEYVHVP